MNDALVPLLVLQLFRKIHNLFLPPDVHDSLGIVIEAFVQEIQKPGLEFCSFGERWRDCELLRLLFR